MNSESLTLKKILKMKEEIDSLPDPLSDFMRERGFDPDRTVLFLPCSYENNINWGPFGPPSRIKFSSLVEIGTGYLVKDIES